MSQIECVLWIPNQRQDPPAISFSNDGKVIVPSRVGAIDWDNVGIQRSELPSAGTIETACKLINAPNNNIAWPTLDTVTFEAPGFNHPVKINWEQNGLIVRGSIVLPGFNRRVSVLVGRADQYAQFCPNQQKAELWYDAPTPNTSTLCFVGYYIGPNGIIGYAWPVKSEPLDRVFQLPRGMFLVDPTNAELELRVTVLEKKGEMHIIIR